MTSNNMTQTIPKRVVVLGGGGFIGSSIVNKCKKEKIPVLSITRNEVNLNDVEASKKLAKILEPDDSLVVACAVAPVKNIEMLIENLNIAETIADAVSENPVRYFLNISSDAVYQDSKQLLSEKSYRAPTSLHGIMHLAREVRFEMLTVPIGTICPTLIYGSNDPHNGYGPNLFLRNALDGKDIRLFGKGEELRDHIYIEDVSSLCLKMILNNITGRINAVTGKVTSFETIADHCSNLVNKNISVHYTKRNGPMPHDGYRAFDTTYLKNLFPDFTPTELLKGLNNFISSE